MIDALVDWARAVAESLESSPLWLELVVLFLSMLAFLACVVLGLAALAWVVSLPERIGNWWHGRL